jgi:urea transport system ATP-binding protein
VLDQRTAYLSHGQTQWLEIALLLAQDSDLILLDEPTAGMTAHETMHTVKIFKALKGRHTLIVVEHDMAFVREISDIITVMHQGKVLAEGRAEEIQSNTSVKEVYLGTGGILHA